MIGLGRGGFGEDNFLDCYSFGRTFPSVHKSFAALLEGTADYLYDSAKKEKTFIPYLLKKVRED